MLSPEQLCAPLADGPLAQWIPALQNAIEQVDKLKNHGDLPRWLEAFQALPELDKVTIDLDHELGVNVQSPTLTDNEKQTALNQALSGLKPWRKGPFKLGQTLIDTEWHSDWKWNRVAPHITPLAGRNVLDVGCGNGYHLWRMLGQNAQSIVGIDPGILFLLQFKALQKYINRPTVNLLPLTMEQLPSPMHAFDTVFSMGVLYHRKDPIAHLHELHQALKADGEIILETLVTTGEDASVLNIPERYARMRNVWALPTVPMLAKWMKQADFDHIRCVSVDITSVLEQRTTEWMPFESLNESLDPDDKSLTVEGLPRPRRAVMIATPKHR